MTSPLVNRLLTKLDQSSDLETRALLSAELACYFARVGEFEEAEALRQELRKTFGDGRSVRVSIQIMCIEALMLYFKELDPKARDRMVRAKLLSTAWREDRLIALTSAWLAHIDLNLNQFDLMVDSIASCFSVIDSDDGTAECRVSLVLGDAFFRCGETSASQHWYERARTAAVRIGDQAAIGALTYNRAALRVAATRLASLKSPVEDRTIAAARAEVKSAVNYQAVARLSSLEHLLQSALVGVCMLEGKFPEASSLIKGLLRSSDVPVNSGEHLILEADYAWCLAATGRCEMGLRQVSRVSQMSLSQLSADDRALIYWSLSNASSVCGDDDAGTSFCRTSEIALAEHAAPTAHLKALLLPYRDGGNLVRTH